MTPELIADHACHTGENPLWHEDEKRVYWTDIPAGRLFRYDPATGGHEQCYDGRPVGGFTLQEDGALLLFMDRGSVMVWRDGDLRTVIDELPGEIDSRFNDVIADPEGRVFCGTMSSDTHAGRLYRLETDGTPYLVLDCLGTPNGMGFTRDLAQMYVTDSRRAVIWIFDYDRASGHLSNRREFYAAEEGEGRPDGMTVDADGFVWSARWDGARVVRHAPDGSRALQVEFPVKKVSSVTFGGPGRTDLFVTTAGGHEREKNGETAGALYRILGAGRGVAEFRSRVLI